MGVCVSEDLDLAMFKLQTFFDHLCEGAINGLVHLRGPTDPDSLQFLHVNFV